MRVIAFNGSPRKNGNTSILLNMVLDELKGEGVETELVHLPGNIQGCDSDYKCVENKDGKCVRGNDIINDCIAKMQEAEGILLGTPTYFSDISARTKAFIERCGFVSRANGDILKLKVGAGVIAERRAGGIHAFNTISSFFLLNQMIVVGSSYWNLGIGKDPGDVKEDSEGVKTMKRLGQNMAWLLYKIHA